MKKAILELTELFAVGKPSIDKYTGITDDIIFIGDGKEGELFKYNIEGLAQRKECGIIHIDSTPFELCERRQSLPVIHDDVCAFYETYA